LKHTRFTAPIAGIAGIAAALCLSGCVTNGSKHGTVQPASQPAGSTPVVGASPTSRPIVAARPVVVEQVVPEPNDIYISAATNADIVFVGGNTYIWATGPDNRRHRHFYGHGDRRGEVFRRRENLRSVRALRPEHPTASHAAHEYGYRREDHSRLEHSHASEVPGRHPLKNHLALNNQSHHATQQGQQRPIRNQTFRDASSGHSGLRHRPEPNMSATKAEVPPRS
jgi:hypothetical protein